MTPWVEDTIYRPEVTHPTREAPTFELEARVLDPDEVDGGGDGEDEQ